ncbi:hypothetical protein I3760_16G075400 [Carya illinoinensis]|nr:hypothetical protein I3760_16G075400 [Carya illinoinensis]
MKLYKEGLLPPRAQGASRTRAGGGEALSHTLCIEPIVVLFKRERVAETCGRCIAWYARCKSSWGSCQGRKAVSSAGILVVIPPEGAGLAVWQIEDVDEAIGGWLHSDIVLVGDSDKGSPEGSANEDLFLSDEENSQTLFHGISDPGVEECDRWLYGAFASVYSPNSDNDKRLLWDELAGVHNWWDLLWCIGGDFNVTRFPSKCFGNRRMRPTMLDFSECIFELNLVDLPLVGGLCTWANNQTWSPLDRFLISPKWEIHYPEVWQKRLSRLCLDHWPIMLACGGIQRRFRYFKFKNTWLKLEDFVDRAKQWWSSY